MFAGNRQKAIVYEFLLHDTYLNYQYLSNRFVTSEKTIRNDIRVINDSFEQHKIKIKLKRGRGFYLTYPDEKVIQSLKASFNYRYYAPEDLQGSCQERVSQVMNYILLQPQYIRMDALSKRMNLSKKTISNALQEVRRVLSTYQLTLKTYPHHGMKLIGTEIRIRYCITDTICYYPDDPDIGLFDDNIDFFYLSASEKQKVTAICVNFIRKYHIHINQIELRKLIILIMVSHQRFFYNNQIEIPQDFYQSVCMNLQPAIEELCQDLGILYQVHFQEAEKQMLAVFILSGIEYNQTDPLLAQNERVAQLVSRSKAKIAARLLQLQICKTDDLEAFFAHIECLLTSAAIRAVFRIIEHNPNSRVKCSAQNSPVALYLGLMCVECINEIMDCELGEKIALDLVQAVYCYIRDIKNIRHLNQLVIFTPTQKACGDALKRRIKDRYSNIIKKIDVLNTYELLTSDLSQYTYMICFDNAHPLGVEITIPILDVDFYFTNDDVDNFYENISVPNRIYASPFAQLYQEDYNFGYEYTDFETLKEEIRSFYDQDAYIDEQLDSLRLQKKLIYNNRLNIVLFTPNKKNTFSKLYRLKKAAMFHNVNFLDIYIHCIAINKDLIKLRTGEKIIRNLTALSFTNQRVFVEKEPLDFYSFYTEDRYLPLKKRKK